MNAIPTPPSPSSRIHPLLAIAAIAVTLFSLVGIAAIVGWLPTGKASLSEAAPVGAAPTAQPPAPSVMTEPSPAVAEEKAEAQTTRKTASDKTPLRAAATTPASKKATTSAPSPTAVSPAVPAVVSEPAPLAAATTPQAATPPAPPPCPTCGTIENIREIKEKGEASGLGAIAGGVVGGLLGNQIGKGTGNTVATVLGAAGGAYAGHQIEKSQKTVSRYEITVRMNDGTLRQVFENSPPAWRIGDRVRIENGVLFSAY